MRSLSNDTKVALVGHVVVSSGILMFLLNAVGNWHEVPDLALSEKKIRAHVHCLREKQQNKGGGASDFDAGGDGAFMVWIGHLVTRSVLGQ